MKFLADTTISTEIRRLSVKGEIVGVTSNAKIALADGVTSYAHAVDALAEFASELDVSVSPPIAGSALQIIDDARKILKAGPFRIKVPVCTTQGEPTTSAVLTMLRDGIPVNLTAVMAADQIDIRFFDYVDDDRPLFVSLFAGRLRDVGVDPVAEVEKIRRLGVPGLRIIWASTRDLQSINDARRAGCDYVTASPALIDKLSSRVPSAQEMSMKVLQEFDEATTKGRLTLQ